MSNQLQLTVKETQTEGSKPNADLNIKETSSSLCDEVLVDVETANGNLILKRTVRSGIVAIQYNEGDPPPPPPGDDSD